LMSPTAVAVPPTCNTDGTRTNTKCLILAKSPLVTCDRYAMHPVAHAQLDMASARSSSCQRQAHTRRKAPRCCRCVRSQSGPSSSASASCASPASSRSACPSSSPSTTLTSRPSRNRSFRRDRNIRCLIRLRWFPEKRARQVLPRGHDIMWMGHRPRWSPAPPQRTRPASKVRRVAACRQLSGTALLPAQSGCGHPPRAMVKGTAQSLPRYLLAQRKLMRRRRVGRYSHGGQESPRRCSRRLKACTAAAPPRCASRAARHATCCGWATHSMRARRGTCRPRTCATGR
jgi:hypothetical protein